jgi:RNA polymerase sigma-70 factor, ECF subfamily
MKTSMPSAHLPEAVVLAWPGVAPAPMREPPDRGTLDGASLEVLVEHARQGSTEAFGELVRLHEERLFNFLRQITGNDHDAQDLAQDTFVKAFRSIARFQGSGSFTAWLFTIGKRTALNHLRDHRREVTEEAPEQIDFTTPAQAFAEAEERAGLWEMARRLKPDQFEVLWLRYAEGFSVAETARIMRTNQIRVRVLLHRGRGRLAQWLEARGGKGAKA